MNLGQYLRMLLLSCFSPTLCVPMDCSPLGSSVHEILQSRILEWVAISFSIGSSLPRDQTQIPYVCCIGRRVLYHQYYLGSQTLNSLRLQVISKQKKRYQIYSVSGKQRLCVCANLYKGAVDPINSDLRKASLILHKVYNNNNKNARMV